MEERSVEGLAEELLAIAEEPRVNEVMEFERKGGPYEPEWNAYYESRRKKRRKKAKY